MSRYTIKEDAQQLFNDLGCPDLETASANVAESKRHLWTDRWAMEKHTEGINAGDKVIILNQGIGSTTIDVAEVTRTTKTQVILGQKRYYRKDGELVGNKSRGYSSRSTRILPVTSDIVVSLACSAYEANRFAAKIRDRKVAIRELRNFDYASLGDDDLQKLLAQLNNIKAL